jgi:hypothetical protein
LSIDSRWIVQGDMFAERDCAGRASAPEGGSPRGIVQRLIDHLCRAYGQMNDPTCRWRRLKSEHAAGEKRATIEKIISIQRAVAVAVIAESHRLSGQSFHVSAHQYQWTGQVPMV